MGAASGTVEHEVKLGAWAGLAMPDLSEVVPGGSVLALIPLDLQATYYDTEDLRLTRWGVTLRYRRGDELTWTVKLPRDPIGCGIVRQEHNWTGVEARVPAEALHLLRAYIRNDSVVPVARLRTHRLRSEIRDAEGNPLVEIDDDEVSVMVVGTNGRSRRLATRFREIEAELLPGAPVSVLGEVVTRLRAAGASPPDPTPKVVRALGPPAFAPPEVVVPALSARSSTADVVSASVALGVKRLLGHDPGVRLGEDPEEVHQARVATRRLRSDLRTFRTVVDSEWKDALRAELGWIAGLLGAVRDADVLLARLSADVDRLDPLDKQTGAALLRQLVAEREQYRDGLLVAMDSPRYIHALDALVAAASSPPVSDPALGEQPARRVVPTLVQRPWLHLRNAVAGLPDSPEDGDLHRVRIYAKRCRYAAEACVGVIGKDARRFGEAVAEVQAVLGELNDAVLGEAWLRGAANGASGAQALVAGQLIALQRRDARRCRAGWAKAWKPASAKRLRAWLGE